MASAESYWEKFLGKKAPATARGYRNRFNAFLEFAGLTHEGVYDLQLVAERADDPREGDVVVDLAVSFFQHLTEEGYAPGTVAGHASAIKMFMVSNKCNGFTIPREDVPYVDADGSHVITGEQYVAAWDSVSQEFKLRNRALLSFLKDSGIRTGDAARFSVRDYLDLVDLGGGFKTCGRALLTSKRKRMAYVHLGPEATKAIDLYLAHRRDNAGRPYRIKNLGRVEDRVYPLFDEGQSLFLGRGGMDMSVDSLGQVLSRILRPFPKVTAHSLRKFHRTNLQGAGMADGWIKKLQGKAASVYSQPERNGMLTEKYIECYDDALKVFGLEKEEIEQLNMRLVEMTRIVEEQKRSLELMGPAFKFAQVMFDEKRERDRIQESSREPEDALKEAEG